METQAASGVLIVYTGGTVGSVRLNPRNPDDPLVPGRPEHLAARLPFVEPGRMRFCDRIVPVDIVATPRLLDSTNIKPDDWVEIARIIEASYDRYEGFVVLHGTDTMAFTASALAFMFEDLDKPVVLTGSQRSIGEVRTDAVQNVVTAVELAAARSLGGAVVPEVSVFFRDVLLRGCRVTKRSASAYDGFHSPNLGPLARAGDRLRVDGALVRRPAGAGLTVRYGLDRNLAVLELSPLMSHEMLDRILSADDLHGVILKTYGAGNAPTDEGFLSIVEKAVRRGVRVVAVTQCPHGSVELGHYEVSAGLLERGVISGLDMTGEAAQTKLAVLLADQSLADSIEALMPVNLRGELGQSLFELGFSAGAAAPEGVAWQERPFPAASHFRRDRIREAKLRIQGLTVEGDAPATLDLRVGLNEARGRPGPDSARCLGVAWDPAAKTPGTVFVDMTAAVRNHLDPGRKTSVTVVSESGRPVRWRSLALTVFADE